MNLNLKMTVERSNTIQIVCTISEEMGICIFDFS